ncbi:hypothetical protein CR152_02525 [Massilia violaceinigra]|uniref:Uncharacterized protein n=1 Tax=Massilia violaceinigra TaxID=2045208 RepID=A0A2D2DEV7_9BURK|nr:hypothetical protein [Massilia violaceinigra]ATQ73516.1 hypothetical protein CR152_02525 [Massilia violaceinigra]
MLNKPVDKKALKLLAQYDSVSQSYARLKRPLEPDEQQWIDIRGVTSDEEFAYMKEHGLAFDPVDMKHDEAVRKCFEYAKQCKKSHVTDLFLASFTAERLDFRAALAPFAMMQTMPDHGFTKYSAPGFCAVCSAAPVYKDMDTTDWNVDRYKYGSIGLLKVPYVIQFHLAQHLELARQKPTADDFHIFNAILDTLRSVDAKTKPKDLHKELKKIEGFKATNDQCRVLVEALGIAGILETQEHKGYLTHYTNPGLAPSKSHSSDWAYPVDFWTGADGVNKKALEFWFGAYPEIRLD